MNLIRYIILGIIQGLTEFLPVSSSGHLVIFQKVLGVNEPGVIFEITVHIGTLIAVLIYFRKDIYQVIRCAFIWKKDANQKVKFNHHLLFYLALSTIITGVLGFTFKDTLEAIFDKLYLVGFMLLVTGILLFISDQIRNTKKKRLNLFSGVSIGIAQSLAILPGISRSGTTITMGIFAGLKRELATRFSFLLSIPAILGAGIIKIKDFESNMNSTKILPYLVAGIAAAIVGYLAIAVLIKLINKAKLRYFSFYCWILGIISITVALI